MSVTVREANQISATGQLSVKKNENIGIGFKKLYRSVSSMYINSTGSTKWWRESVNNFESKGLRDSKLAAFAFALFRNVLIRFVILS